MSSSERKRLILGIDGMTCSSCSGTVEGVLEDLPGISNVHVALATNSATLEFLESMISSSEIVDEIKSVGFDAQIMSEVEISDPATNSNNNKLVIPIKKRLILGIDGMTCSSCSGTVEGVLEDLSGVSNVQVTLTTNSASLDFIESMISSSEIVDEIKSVGFGAQIMSEVEISNSKINDPKNRASCIGQSESTNKNFILCFDEGGIAPTLIQNFQSRIRSLEGVINVSRTSFGDKEALQISLDDSKIGPRHLVSIGNEMDIGNISVHSHGGFMMANRLHHQYTVEMQKQRRDAIISSILTIPILILSHLVGTEAIDSSFFMTQVYPGLDLCAFTLFLLSTPVQWIVGWRFHKKAVLSMQVRNLGMDFLISTGTTAAYLFSLISLVAGIISGQPNDMDAAYFETSAVLITVVVIGKFAETYARGLTANEIHNLSACRARRARIINDKLTHELATSKGLWVGPQVSLMNAPNSFSRVITIASQTIQLATDEEVDASLVHRGDCLRLVSGEVVPADGIVFSGSVGIDESMLTGESALVTKTVDQIVYGGTVVAEGSATMVVIACGDDSALGKIVATVQEAQSSKPPIQEKADIVAKYFVPFVASMSFLTFNVWITAWKLGYVPQEWYNSASMTSSGANNHMKHHMGDSSSAGKTGSPVLFAFFFSLAVWVSACPCAFGLATPTAIIVATFCAAKYGILIRKGAALQHAAEVTNIALDKTGTLTLGKPTVSDFFVIDGKENKLSKLPIDARLGDILRSDQSRLHNISILLSIMQKAEMKSSHPLAKGIVEFCQARLIELRKDSKPSIDDITSAEVSFDVFAGQGISMTLTSSILSPFQNFMDDSFIKSKHNSEVIIGNASFLASKGVALSNSQLALTNQLRSNGRIAVYVAIAQSLVSIIGLSDTVRPEARAVITYLHNLGVQCYMVTGDEWNTAVAIGRAVGIESKHIFANAKPIDKENFVRALQDYNEPLTGQKLTQKCLFIGDGTNDSPAMARASVGIAMAGGTDIAIEAGDVVFHKNSLASLATIISLSKTTMRRIWINFCWAFGYNLILIPVAAGVFFPVFKIALAPMMAGMAMAFSSISIVISSLLLGFFRPPLISGQDSNVKSSYKSFGSSSLNTSSQESNLEMREFSSEDEPLTCQCVDGQFPSSNNSYNLSGNVKSTNQTNNIGGASSSSRSRSPSISSLFIGEEYDLPLISPMVNLWKSVFYRSAILPQVTNYNLLQSYEFNDTTVDFILNRARSSQSTSHPLHSAFTDGGTTLARSNSPTKLNSHSSNGALNYGGTEKHNNSSLSFESDANESCGCGGYQCYCPPTCNCKSFHY